MSRQSQPNFTTVQPDGSVGAIFPGGIQMPTTDLAELPDAELSRTVRWTREADGALIGELSAFSNAPPGNFGDLRLRSVSPNGLLESIIEMQAGFNITARVAAAGTRVLNSNDKSSSYLMIAGNGALDGGVWGTQALAVFGGLVASNGVLSWGFPNNLGVLTTSRTAVGSYTIDYTAMAFTSTPIIVGSTYQGGVFRTTGTYNSDVAQVNTINATTLALQDLIFGFVGVGPLN